MGSEAASQTPPLPPEGWIPHPTTPTKDRPRASSAPPSPAATMRYPEDQSSPASTLRYPDEERNIDDTV
eukprot:521907-Pyramimonas_sp.AAC.1